MEPNTNPEMDPEQRVAMLQQQLAQLEQEEQAESTQEPDHEATIAAIQAKLASLDEEDNAEQQPEIPEEQEAQPMLEAAQMLTEGVQGMQVALQSVENTMGVMAMDVSKSVDKIAEQVSKITKAPSEKTENSESREINKLEKLLTRLDSTLSSLPDRIKPSTPEKPDFGPLTTAVKRVQEAVENIRIPIARGGSSTTGTVLVAYQGTTGLIPVTAANPLPTSGGGGGGGGTSMVDDSAFTIGTTSFVPVGGTYRSTLDAVDDGDGGAAHMTSRRAIHVNLRDNSGNEVSVGGGTQYDEDAASTGGEKLTLAGTVRQDTIASSTSLDGDYANLKTNSVGRLYTSATIDTALPAGTNGIGKLTANSGVDIGDVDVTSIVPGVLAASLGKAEDAIAGSGDTGVMALAVRADTAAATGANGDYVPLLTDASGRLHTNGSGVTQPVSDASGSLTVDAPVGTPVFVRLSDGTSAITALPVTDNAGSLTVDGTVSLGAGAAAIGSVSVSNASGASAVNIQDGGNSITVDGAVTVSGTATVSGTVAATQSGTWTVQPGNTANTTAWLVNDAPATSGGLSKFHLVSASGTNVTNIKSSAGQVYAISVFNINAAARYLKFHNTSGTPTAGSGVTDTYLIPANGSGVVFNIDKGIAFSTGIGISLVTGIADSDTTGVAASEIIVQVYYK